MIVYMQMIEDPAEQGKFENIYRTYRNDMYKAAMRILNNVQDAAVRLEKALDASKVVVTGDASGATCEAFMQELLNAI